VFIIRTLRANAHAFSAKTYALHLQLILLLLAQLLAPVLSIVFPLGYVIYTVLAGEQFTRTVGCVGILLLAAYAIINPLLTLSFISPYKLLFRFNRYQIF
jgi:hypothetical protein